MNGCHHYEPVVELEYSTSTLGKSVELLLQIKTLNLIKYLEEKIRRTAATLVCIGYLFSENYNFSCLTLEQYLSVRRLPEICELHLFKV